MRSHEPVSGKETMKGTEDVYAIEIFTGVRSSVCDHGVEFCFCFCKVASPEVKIIPFEGSAVRGSAVDFTARRTLLTSSSGKMTL